MPKQLVDTETGEILEPPEGEELSLRAITGMVNAAYQHKRDRDRAKNSYEALTRSATANNPAGPIRAWLEAHRDEEIQDGETRIKAFLQDKGGSLVLDVISMSEKEPALLAWLANKGALKLDLNAWKALDGKAREALQVQDYISPGFGSQALIVEKERD